MKNIIKTLGNKKRLEIATLAEQIYQIGFTDGQAASSSVEDQAVETIKLTSVYELKKGDKVRFIGKSSDYQGSVTNGRIYEISQVYAEGIVHFIDDDLDDNDPNYISRHLVHLFEKVVETETFEHEGLLLRKVDRKRKNGDFVRFHGTGNTATVNGKLYEVYNKDFYKNDNGYEYHIDGWSHRGATVEVFEVVEGLNPQIPMYDETVEPTPAPLTANQQRAQINQQAKKFVEDTLKSANEEGLVINHDYYKNPTISFFRKGNKTTCVITPENTMLERFVGRSLCSVGDVFNEWIGKAIALARALEIDIPSEFMDAVQPDEKVAGMMIQTGSNGIREIVIHDYQVVTGKCCHIYSSYGKRGTIIDDTNAIYSV